MFSFGELLAIAFIILTWSQGLFYYMVDSDRAFVGFGEEAVSIQILCLLFHVTLLYFSIKIGGGLFRFFFATFPCYSCHQY